MYDYSYRESLRARCGAYSYGSPGQVYTTETCSFDTLPNAITVCNKEPSCTQVIFFNNTGDSLGDGKSWNYYYKPLGIHGVIIYNFVIMFTHVSKFIYKLQYVISH